MRVALVFYGEPREYILCMPQWKILIRKYNPDIFLHCWEKPEVIYQFEKPKLRSALVMDRVDFRNMVNGINEFSTSAKSVLPQMFSIWQSDRLRIEQEDVQMFQYDWVIRARMDIFLHDPDKINLESLDRNNYYVCANHWYDPNEMFDDNLMIGTSRNMTLISPHIYQETISRILTEKIIPSGELMFRNFFVNHGLRHKLFKIPELNFTLGRNI